MNARTAYRSTFKEYSRKLDALEQLRGSGASDGAQIETARLEVEKARVAHSMARDELAKELAGTRRLAPSLQKTARAGAAAAC